MVMISMKKSITISKKTLSLNVEITSWKKSFLMIFILLLCTASLNSILFSQPLATGHSKFLGCSDDGSIPAIFDTYWNQITPENSGKWGSVEVSRDQYNWGTLDQTYNFAKQRGIPFKLHTLIWGGQQPSWISNLSLEEKAEEVEEWIRLVGERYPDIDMVDVVNEPLPSHQPPDGRNGHANYKDALGGNGQTGWDWVIWSFEKARQYLPDAKLLINDYGIINDNNATTSYLKIINLLKDRGLIDGIGVQGHRFELESADTTTLKNNLTKLAATCLPVYISEFDLGNVGNSGTPNDATQLRLYQKIFPVLWKHPGVQGITLWGCRVGMWQSTCYLIRSDGTERPALEWLRSFLAFPGGYRSHQAGNWNDVNTWERYDGNAWVYPAATIPSVDASMISIQKGHTVTVTASDSADQVVINTGAELVINSGVTFLVKNGEGVDLTTNGKISNFGRFTQEDSANLKAMTGSSYIHNQDGGIIPELQWSYNSTIEFTSLKTAAPSNGNQDFHHVLWNCPEQSTDLTLGWNRNTIGGNITIRNTGTGRWLMCAPTAGDSATVTIMGNITQYEGQFSTNGTDNANTTITINHSGNINVRGGNFSVSRGSQGGTGSAIWNFMGDSFRISKATTQNSNPGGAKFVFAKVGDSQSLSFSDVTFGGGGFPVEVDSGATLDMGTSILQGDGSFNLKAGGTLITAHQEGIDGSIANTGVKTFDIASSFGFDGSVAQVTGSLLPDFINSFILNNGQGVTLSKSVVVNGTLEIQNGALFFGSHVFSYGANASLKYSGSSAQTTTDAEFPSSGGPENLIIANSRGVTLHASRTVGNLDLMGKLELGANTITANSATNGESRSAYVVTEDGGFLKLISVGTSQAFFPVGTTSYTPVWIINNGAADGISVCAIKDSQKSPCGGKVNVKWIISEDIPGGGDYTLQFGWISQETSDFRADRAGNARIFNLTDSTEAGTGDYTLQLTSMPYTVARGGIADLGPFGVGIFREVTGIDEYPAGLPLEYCLSQNYPNPFNPSTTIRYTLARDSKTKIVIYNLLGNEVATLVNTHLKAGDHRVEWNTENMASGIYVYKMITKDFVQTRKMTLLK
jgi:endo-1,4-beta-xylanase